MKKYFIIQFALLISVPGIAQVSLVNYPLPDSIRAVQFMAEVNIISFPENKEASAGISTDLVKLYFESGKKNKEIVFSFPKGSKIISAGLGVDKNDKDEVEWEYNWSLNETYKLLIAVASDSAENFSLYSGYIWLPKESKWKLIGTCRIDGRWNGIRDPSSFFSDRKKLKAQVNTGQVWVQRANGSWKNMKEENLPNPMVVVTNHIDSVQQYALEMQDIQKAISLGKTDVKDNVGGVYYSILKEGTGRQVSVNDIVVAFYKGYLFSNGLVFDQTKETPATFPLKRLIKGWQLGVPLLKVGGKIRLVIPSAHAYSIRTRAAKIPPNSILVFEIEVLDVKPPL